MKASTLTLTELKLTKAERDALNLTMETLKQMVKTFGDNAELTSVTTGEVILTNEFPRVLGILGGLRENNYFEQKATKKGKTFEELLAESLKEYDEIMAELLAKGKDNNEAN